MIKYTGEECLICKEKFTDSDDIVVCPECGTPYHSNCYKEKKGCVNFALHESKGSWMAQAVKRHNAEDALKKVCPECNFINNRDAEKCRNCGTDFAEKECRNIDLSDKKVVRIELDADRDYFGMNPMEIIDENSKTTLGELADYVKSSKLYFMLVFRRFKMLPVRISFNFMAFLFPEYYCAGRKMYLLSAILIIVKFILSIPEKITLIAETPQYAMLYPAIAKFASELSISSRAAAIMGAANIAINVLFALAFNDFYYHHVLSKINKLKKKNTDYLAYRNKLKQEGGVSIPGIVVAFLGEGLLLTIFILLITMKIFLF